MYGAGAVLIPDVLFERGVHLVEVHRVSDPQAFEEGVLWEMNLEASMQRTQVVQTLRREDQYGRGGRP